MLDGANRHHYAPARSLRGYSEMGQADIRIAAKAKLTPADLVNAKPDECSLWRMEMVNCSYDYASQTRRWSESEKIRQLMMTTGAPTSSTSFDGEKDE